MKNAVDDRVSVYSLRGVMPPLADQPCAYLARERENGELKGEVATLRWQLEKLHKLAFGPDKSKKLDRSAHARAKGAGGRRGAGRSALRKP